MRRLWLVLFCALLALACRPKSENASGDPAIPFVIKDDSPDLLLTWIDDKGDFHVETKVKDIPFVGRDAVRVVDPNRDDGTHDGKIFVADCRTTKPDGTYPIKVMTRTEFDQIALDRRAKHGPTLATSDAPDGGSGVINAPGTGQNALPQGNANLQTVIIYGASWCGPCHEAAAYLRKKGIPFVEKDVDEDRSAQSEMQGKLRKAGLPGGSIPVIDVRGKILVGFNPRAIDEALGRAT